MKTGPLEIVCDAPPYSIVAACARVGVKRPLDVRWVNAGRGTRDAGRGAECHCGRRIPVLERVIFTFITGAEAAYWIGQCPGCLTIFWDD